MRVRALVCDADQRFTLADVRLPEAGAGDIVARTLVSGISVGTEFALIRNKLSWGPYPICTGYQAVGLVERVGAAVTDFAVGQKIYYRMQPNFEPDDSDHLVREAKAGDPPRWALGSVTVMYLSDTVRAFVAALDAARQPGVRVYNATAPRVASTLTVPELIAAWLPDSGLDLSWYERAGHEHDALFDTRRIADELGFVAERIPGV